MLGRSLKIQITQNEWRKMKNHTKLLLALAAGALLLSTALLVMLPVASAAAPARIQIDARRDFYLTRGAFTGSQALTACAAGFHMASIWEIKETTLLRHNTRLGRNLGDSAFGGPPSAVTLDHVDGVGWLRLGSGGSDCSRWTSGSSSDLGAYAALEFVSPFDDYGTGGTSGDPCDREGCEPMWLTGRNLACDGTFNSTSVIPGVWCVQD